MKVKVYELSFSVRKKILFIFLLLFGVLLFGTLGYMILEGMNFIDALYMTVITIATVGFKEVKELDEAGKVFTIILIFLGFGVFTYALTTGAQILIEGEIKEMFTLSKVKSILKQIKDHYIVCGYGRMGENIVKELKAHGKEIVVIEKSENFEKEKNVIYLIGDATKDEILLEAGIKSARALITVLPSDADNLYVVVSAKALNPKIFIVARASDNEAKKKMKMAGADKVICPYHIGALRIAHTVLKPNVVDFWEFVTDPEHPNINVEEIIVSRNSPMVGKNLKEIGIGKLYNIIVIGIRRKEGEFEFNPSAETVVKEHDILIVLGSSEKIETFKKEMNL